MDNEKFQELVIDHLAKLNQKFTALDQKVSNLDLKVTGFDLKVTSMEQKVTDLDQKRTEHSEILQAVRHAQETQTAQLDQINLTLARIEGCQDQMAGDISFLVRKAAEHDEHIRELRRAK